MDTHTHAHTHVRTHTVSLSFLFFFLAAHCVVLLRVHRYIGAVLCALFSLSTTAILVSPHVRPG